VGVGCERLSSILLHATNPIFSHMVSYQSFHTLGHPCHIHAYMHTPHTCIHQYVYACMHVYFICVHMNTCIICTRIYIYIYAAQVCECGCEGLMYTTAFCYMYILTSFNICATCTRVCFFVCMHVCMCVYVRMCANVGMHVCMYVFTMASCTYRMV